MACYLTSKNGTLNQTSEPHSIIATVMGEHNFKAFLVIKSNLNLPSVLAKNFALLYLDTCTDQDVYPVPNAYTGSLSGMCGASINSQTRKSTCRGNFNFSIAEICHIFATWRELTPSKPNVLMVKQSLCCFNTWLAGVHCTVCTWYSGYYYYGMYSTKKIRKMPWSICDKINVSSLSLLNTISIV